MNTGQSPILTDMTDFHIRVQGWWALSTPKPAGLFSYSHEGCWSFCFSGQKSTDCPLPVPQACKLRMENNFDICHLDSRPQQAHLLFLHGLLAAFSPSHLLREALCLLRWDGATLSRDSHKIHVSWLPWLHEVQNIFTNQNCILKLHRAER